MQKIIKIWPLVGFVLFLSCSDSLSDDLKTIEIGKYKLEVPSNFRVIEGQGYDSYVGKIEESGIHISYDYGIYTSPEQDIPEEDFEVKNDTINGHSRQIVIPKNSDRNSTSVHITELNENSDDPFMAASLKMWSEGLTKRQQETVIQIFETLEALEALE